MLKRKITQFLLIALTASFNLTQQLEGSGATDTWIGTTNVLNSAANWAPSLPGSGDEGIFGASSSFVPHLTSGNTFTLQEASFTSPNHSISENFTTFGNTFTIKGVPLERNSVDGVINLTYKVDDSWIIYAEAIGQQWEKSSSYSFLGGVGFKI